MATTKTKIRKTKRTPAKAQRLRARERAAIIIKRIGYRLGFMGGMAFTETQVIGMQQAVAGNTSVHFKEQLAEELQHNLRHTKRDWTLAVAFVSEVDGELVITSESKAFLNTTPKFLDKEGTDWLFERSGVLWTAETFASLWITVPALIEDADGLFEEFDDDLEAAGAFDRENIARVTERRKEIASLKETMSDGLTLKGKVDAIAEKVKAAGWPISIRLLQGGRYVSDLDNYADLEWESIGSCSGTLVSGYLDESETEIADVIPDDINDIVMRIAAPIMEGTE